jgi:anti-sigma regulatory factor (Ser/Thr protein kinase)
MLVSRRLPSVPESVRVARSLADSIAHQADPERVDDLRLIISELATNVVQHAGSDSLEVRLEADGGRARVEIIDRGPGFTSVPPGDPAEPRGRGLPIVRAIADAWGVETNDETIVWAEVTLRSALRERGGERA